MLIEIVFVRYMGLCDLLIYTIGFMHDDFFLFYMTVLIKWMVVTMTQNWFACENCNFVKTVKKFDILMIPKMVEKIVTSSPPFYSRVVLFNKLKVDLGKMTSSA